VSRTATGLGTDETIGFNQLFLWDKMRMYHLVINGWLENPYQWRFRKFIELNGGGFSSATFDYWRASTNLKLRIFTMYWY
jgi:hypothetical protein